MARRFFRLICALIMALGAFMPYAAFAEDAAQTDPAFTDEEKQYIASHRSVRVGFVQDRIPVSFADENGSSGGISRYIFDRISEISGIEFEYVALPTGDVTYDYLLGEKLDLVTSVEYNEENKHARGILISEPYLSSRKVIVARNDLNFRYGANLKAAVSTGSQTLKKVLAGMFPSFELKDYDSIQDCLDAVDSGDSDILIMNQYVVEYWLSKPRYESLKVVPISGLDDKLCFSAVVSIDGSGGLSQEDGQTLINILDRSIACMNDDEVGSYIIEGVMENQYEYTFYDFVSKYRYSVIMLAAAFLVIILLMVILSRQHIHIAAARAEEKAKGQFLSTMSHEIRTPLNGLVGLNYLMTRQIDDKDKLEGYIWQSSVTAKYLLSLVNDILDSSQLRSHTMKLNEEPIDLTLIVETVNSVMQGSVSDRDLTYTFNSEIPYPYIIGDGVRIQQVLLSLLDNARKFTPEGGVVELSVTQQLDGEENVVTTASVTDTGKGMSEEFRKRIFDVFARELETVSKGNQGTGLGLSISRELALLMNGDLTCTSEKGKGSTFTFTFPGKITGKPRDLSRNGTRWDRPRVLVAEDNELNGEIILELLKSDGFEADIAENGKKALQMFSDSEPHGYDVILMDLLMPELDGFETSKAIRALDREDAKTVKIFACTANSFNEEREKAFASGMDDFISKPVDIDELLSKLYAVPRHSKN